MAKARRSGPCCPGSGPKSNTTKRRTHSLFRQGCMLYDLIPNMPEVRLLPLIERFTVMLAELPVFADTFGVV